ncbi:hypothetical protein pEaSNUABM9_00185 [Erwinia phage pEa_SNUABM_9]|nr:hypothetical protein pEaSNUABM9_00185 [Erwinia phage pEa_SNUABM_9]
MNLFYNVFNAMTKGEATMALINTYQIAVGALTKSNPEVYQQFRIIDEMVVDKRVKEMPHKDNELCNNIRRLMNDAFHEVVKDNEISEAVLLVKVSDGLMLPENRMNPDFYKSAVSAVTIEIQMSVFDRPPLWHRAILVLPPYSQYKDTGVKLEWDRSAFPRPDQTVTDEAPVLVLREEDMKLISTGDETIQDFAVLAIRAGWRTVQIFGTQLVLVK